MRFHAQDSRMKSHLKIGIARKTGAKSDIFAALCRHKITTFAPGENKKSCGKTKYRNLERSNSCLSVVKLGTRTIPLQPPKVSFRHKKRDIETTDGWVG